MRIVTAAGGRRRRSARASSVYLQCAAATPSVLLDALVARAAELRDVGDRPPPHRGPRAAPRARDGAATSAIGRCSSGRTPRRRSTRAGPTTCRSSCPTCPRCSTTGALPLDAVFVNATPPDAHGFCSLGTSRRGDARGDPGRDDGRSSSSTARCRGRSATASSTSPRSTSRSRSTCPPYEHRAPGRSATSSGGSARYVADLVADGATLQLGIGAIPAATALGPRRQAATSASTPRCSPTPSSTSSRPASSPGPRKERNRGKIVTAFVMGTRAPVRLRPRQPDGRDAAGRLHQRHPRHPLVRRMVTAINSAIEVDLTGQVVADSIGHRMYSGVGGQMDFIRGAALAAEGRAIIALPSTAGPTARRPRITPALKEGAGVVTTRAHVRTVVTEWGVAELWGRASASARGRSSPSPTRTTATGSPTRRTSSTTCRGSSVRGRVRRSALAQRAGTPAAVTRPRFSVTHNWCVYWWRMPARARSHTHGTRDWASLPPDRPPARAPVVSAPESRRPSPSEGRMFGWVPGVPSGTHLTRIVGDAAIDGECRVDRCSGTCGPRRAVP